MPEENIETGLVVVDEPSAFDIAMQPRVEGNERSFAEALIPELAEMRESAASESATEISDPAEGEAVNAVSSELSELAESLGGIEGIKMLAEVVYNENPVQLMQNLAPEAQQEVLWNMLDDYNNQEMILSDPEVKKAIADFYFQGHDLDEVIQVIEDEFEPAADFAERKVEREAALTATAEQVHSDIFYEPAMRVAKAFGQDLNTNEALAQAYLTQVAAFSWLNRRTIDELVRAGGKGNQIFVTANKAKLSNMFTAHMTKMMHNVTKGSKSVSKKPSPAKEIVNDIKNAPVELDALDMNESDFARKFAEEFKRTRQERGL